MGIKEYCEDIARKSKEAFEIISTSPTSQKNYALSLIAKQIRENKDFLIEENKKDIEFTRSKGRSEALIDRVVLNEKRIDGIVDAIQNVILLDDPVGKVVYSSRRPNGMIVNKIKVPIGTILMIYEARPNVTVDAATLILKSGNTGILRGGSEAYNTNIALSKLISKAIEDAGLPKNAIQYVDRVEHEVVDELLKIDSYIDLVIPRGGEGLIRSVVEKSKIPVLRQEKGVCHVYVDKSADKEMAERITINAKTQRPSVCNAAETLLIHKDYPYKKELLEALIKKNVKLKGCRRTLEIVSVEEAREEDYYNEYLDYIMNVKIVDSTDEAIAHIKKYGSGHTESIVTSDYFEANKFLSKVDSSTVMVNASTRFTDGGEFGLGAEIGISTHKLHARGPMGLIELTSDKWIVYGNGQVRE
ncbi:MAG: glutamate-5-semialdehyde dehydrogenase [Spirochaetia bacterium]|nr:glutamate-5-semialdehyde dehydrogenase [Spirochaetota bacterium]MCX8096463.1 glutamate-5-semialdehyde dehydrogenase [Spirochaetota bacterium]MDW8112733.1 glutamate-5-semialdehyde dehydrogenase [Spirochaetia bacterium]